MAAAIDDDQRAQVALVSRQDAARALLRKALGDFGADVVAEQDAGSLDVAALRKCGATVVIVSLDSDNDAEFEALQPLLGDSGVSVVFDEASVSSQLSGWDLARWARHLAAKVLGLDDADPPRPAGAEAPGGGGNYMPVPGAPPTPEQLAGEPMMEEFTIEADQLADAVPTDYLPMEESPSASQVPDEDHLGLDAGSLETALSALDAKAEVSPMAVPDATPEDPDFELPEADFSALDIGELSAGAASEAAPTELSPAGEDADPMADTLAGKDFDSDEPVNFASFDADEVSIDLDADEDVARLAAQLDEQDDAPAQAAVEDLSFADDRSGAVDESPTLEVVEEVTADSGLDISAGLDVDDIAGVVADTGDDKPDRGFDFSSLSLAPMEGEDAWEADQSVQAGSEAKRTPSPSPRTDAPSPALETAESSAESRPPEGRAVFSLEPMDDESAAEEAHAAAARADAPDGVSRSQSSPESPLASSLASSLESSLVAQSNRITRVIVLGASIGGPDALRTFLGGIPKGFPALFLLAQHLESGFFGRLAEQLQKASAMPVRVVDPTEKAADGQVLVVSAEQRVRIAKDGGISMQAHAEPPRYQPCIDDVMTDAADAFGKAATAIIFSGMAGDAIEGSVYLTAKGGEVWAQDSESCVVSSMVDGARARGVVEFTGSPRELAARCVEKYGA